MFRAEWPLRYGNPLGDPERQSDMFREWSIGDAAREQVAAEARHHVSISLSGHERGQERVTLLATVALVGKWANTKWTAVSSTLGAN